MTDFKETTSFAVDNGGVNNAKRTDQRQGVTPTWMFEVVLDHGEHDTDTLTSNDIKPWVFRNDPFSTYRASFEVRITRLCQRLLMFHHFVGEEEGVGNDCLVRSTDFTYSYEQDPTSTHNPIYTFLRTFTQTPRVGDLANIVPIDLLGNGTACLVWSSPLPDDAGRPMRYVNLTSEQKPHLLIKTVNNLGAETRIQYAPSTKSHLQDKYAGKPWITRLPFPVHVVERVETYDHISRNCFVTRYAYHHGYFDSEEREFRGFGMVEQFDTEELAALTTDGTLSAATNIDGASHMPPVHTKTWFHTGVYLGREHLSDFFVGLFDTHDTGEYCRELGLNDAQAKALLLPDTILPSCLTLEEEREASRSLLKCT